MVAAGAGAALVEAMVRSRFRVDESETRFEKPRSHTSSRTRLGAHTRPHLLTHRTPARIVMAFVRRLSDCSYNCAQL
jgi:hypothetical protein